MRFHPNVCRVGGGGLYPSLKEVFRFQANIRKNHHSPIPNPIGKKFSEILGNLPDELQIEGPCFPDHEDSLLQEECAHGRLGEGGFPLFFLAVRILVHMVMGAYFSTSGLEKTPINRQLLCLWMS